MPAVSAIPGDFDNLTKPGLVNGQRVGFPGGNARLAQVDDRDFDVWVLFGNNGTCRAAL